MHSKSVSHFWEKYITKTRDYGITQKNIRWYVVHAEQYIKHYSTTRLQSHNAVYLEKYLTAKHSQKNMQKNENPILRKIPSVDTLLQSVPLSDLADNVPHRIVIDSVRNAVDKTRTKILEGNSSVVDEEQLKQEIITDACNTITAFMTPHYCKAINAAVS